MMEKFLIYFGLKLLYLIFVVFEQLFILIQGKNILVQDVIRVLKVIVFYFECQRNDFVFFDFYDVVCVEVKDLIDELLFLRYRCVFKRLDDGFNFYRYDNFKDYFKQQFFEVLE